MVAVKAVSKARTQQAAERGAAHTSAEEILKMEIEVMRDLSETRHRNLCAAVHPPPARSRPLTAAAFVPLPAHRRHPTASRRYPAAAATVHARRLTPSTPHAPSQAPPQAPPHAHAAPPRLCQPEVLRLRGGRPVRVPHSAAVHGRRAAGLAAPAVRAGALHRADRRQGRVRRAAGARVRMHAHACACARACTACLWLRSRPLRSPRPSSSAHTRCRSCGAAGAAQVPRAGHRAQRREAAQPDLQRAALGRGLAAQARRLRPRGAAQPRRRAAHRGATHAKP